MGSAVRDHDPGRASELPLFAVTRPRLEDRLSRVRPGGLALVVAAAGSGKSVLLAQWSARAPETHTALLRLTAADADPVVCGRHLVEAVRQCVPDFPALSCGTDGESLGPSFVEAFVTALGDLTADLLLILDDLHAVSDPKVIADLGTIVTGLPVNVRAAVGSRWDPAFPLRQFRLEGRLVEVRRSELAFDVDEGRSLLEGVSGRPVSDAQSAELVDRTDGWAVGMQLAAVSLQGQVDPRPVLDAGDDRQIAEYLAEEVLEQQEPELRRFLLCTSVLEWLSPELCDALTGTGDAKEMLDAAVRRSLFLVPLDRRGERFRYHHLFADLLRLQLRTEEPEAPARLHRRAADWFLERGHLSDAVEHLLAGGDHDRAFEVISQEGFRVFERGEAATLLRWMSTITDARSDAPPAVDLNLLAVQVAADASTSAAETYRRLAGRGDLSPEERATADAYYVVLAHSELSSDEAARASASAIDLLPRLDPSAMPSIMGFDGLATVEAMALYGAAQGELQRGHLVEARDGFARLMSLPAMSYPVWRINALGWCSVSSAWAGHLTEAERLAEAALAVAREVDAEGLVAAATPFLALTAIAVDRGDLDAGDRFWRAADECVRGSRRASLQALLRLAQALLVAASEGPWAGIDLLRRASPVPVGSGLFVLAADALEAGLLVSLGRRHEAETVLARVGGDPVGTPARTFLLLAADDVVGARRVLEGWVPDPKDLRAVVQHGIRTAAVLEAEGHPRAAADALEGALGRAEPEGLRQPFRTMPSVAQMLRALPRTGPRSFASSILDLPASPAAVRAAAQVMVEPLTEREQSVLAHLPTRLSNTEIAAELYISINTMKTHVRNIYRKLGVTGRDAAVARATELGLL